MLVLDWFAIFNIAILATALALTVSIHRIMQVGKHSIARRIDRVCRIGIYLLYAIGLSCFCVHYGTRGNETVTIIYTVVMLGGLVSGTFIYIEVSNRRRRRALEEITHDLLSHKHTESIMHRASLLSMQGNTRDADFLVENDRARRLMVEDVFYEMDIEEAGVLDHVEVDAVFTVLHRYSPRASCLKPT